MHPLPGCRAGVGVVRGEQDVVHRHQRAVMGQWFVLKDIQGGAAEMTGLQGGTRASSSTIGPRAVLMTTAPVWHAQRFGVDQVVGGRVQVAVHGDEVGIR
jgi:hypothetical protein